MRMSGGFAAPRRKGQAERPVRSRARSARWPDLVKMAARLGAGAAAGMGAVEAAY